MNTLASTHPVVEASTGINRKQVAGRSWLIAGGVVLLLLILITELALSVRQESLSWDEGDHIYAGYMSWKRGDFGLNPEHPPLVKMVAALPLLSMHLQEPPLQNRQFKLEAYFGGRDLIYGNDADRVIFRARMAAASFAVLLALLVFLTAREMFGTGAGFIALTLVVFEPNLLAHGAMVTTDTGLTCSLLGAIYFFYRYIKAPSIARLAAVGLAAGLAAISKHSAILLLPMCGLLAITELCRRRNAEDESRIRQALRLCTAILAATAMAAVIVWACYGFRYQVRPDGWQMNPPLASAVARLSPAEGRVIATLARWHVLPESYLYGLADVRAVANFMPSFLLGRIYAHGVWFYFPVTFVIKATLAMLLLLILAGFAIAARKLRAGRELLFLTIPPGLYLLVSMTSKLNIGARHILLLFMFSALVAAGAAWALIRADRRWAWPVAALLLFHVVSSARAFPTSYMAYSNELWGGPAATYKYLTDSNTDWGQQLKATKRYLDQRGIKSCWFAYFVYPAIRFEDYGIPCKPLPTPDSSYFEERVDAPPVIEGPVLISAGVLSGFEYGSNVLNPYREFQQLRPAAVIEHGVFVYDGRFNVPRASALGHVASARELLQRKQPEAALAEAQTAANLAPDALQPQMILGEVLTQLNRPAEAHQAFARALSIAQTMEPSAQETWIPRIKGSCRSDRPGKFPVLSSRFSVLQ